MKRVFLLLLCLVTMSGVAAHGSHKNKARKLRLCGIYGQVLRIGFPPLNPYENPDAVPIGTEIPIPDCVIVVRRAIDKSEILRGRSDSAGKFKITLPPGKYEIEPLNAYYTSGEKWPGSGINGTIAQVTVWRGFYTQAIAVFDAGW